MSRFSRKRIIAIALGAVAALGITVAALIPSSGAAFTASDTGQVSVSTANLSLSLSDDSGSIGTFDLAFGNLAPGGQQAKSFSVTNTGSIAANAKIGDPVSGVSFDVPSGQNPDPAKLTFGIDGYQAMTPVTGIGGSIPLGTIPAGQTRTYNLRVGLAQSADNNWQDVKVGATVTVTITQA